MAQPCTFSSPFFFESQTVKSLRAENEQLRTQYDILDRRLQTSLKVMENVKARDDNFYRVMLQMEPRNSDRQFAGLNSRRYQNLGNLPEGALITSLTRKMDLLDRRIYAQSRSFDELREHVGRQKDKLLHIPSILPLDTGMSKLASGFGYRRSSVDGKTRFHSGLDFSAPTGTPVYATGAGTVAAARWSPTEGNTVDIDHGYNYISRYSHLHSMNVKAGDDINRGDVIGLVGSTGVSMAPHLHYEVIFKGVPQNPVNYYFLNVSPEEYYMMIRRSENAGHLLD